MGQDGRVGSAEKESRASVSKGKEAGDRIMVLGVGGVEGYRSFGASKMTK